MCDETKEPPYKSEAHQKVCKSSMHLCLTPQACTHNQIPGSLRVITIRIRAVVVIHRRLISLGLIASLGRCQVSSRIASTGGFTTMVAWAVVDQFSSGDVVTVKANLHRHQLLNGNKCRTTIAQHSDHNHK
jgi:hypothetical protein